MATSKNPEVIVFADGIRLLQGGVISGHSAQADIKWVTKYSLFKIYGAVERLAEVYSSHRNNDKRILKKLLDGGILKDDKRFDHYRNKQTGIPIRVTVTEADNGWLMGTSMGQVAIVEKRELNQLRAEVSERVEQRKAGLASILDF